ncbi:uncharacterized protein BO72DRAFT_460145 [Aspergillus fijiensis CBS 313.89]|uniref:Uncharacterized protein n=1 Tax=Aspergillus fijiensis CBS 313.89 TaxID=1448319 RepID=A0A8G1RN03_9EURO|nr:uncharacterized protein BO72DRAFT_460145 [Aspergillus fijiensis CBS 313.89]RAK75734.1 hypothetical protein BO72DRAFT_460145 [Aspergillus fijiensis CBS 313.89]
MSSIYGTYKGWYLPGFESDESLEHKKIEQQMDETETSASNKEAYAFKYTGQNVDKAFVGKVTQLLVGNGIPNFLFGDMMFRFFGCETDVLSINLSIPDELMDEAVRVLRQAGFYDGPIEPFEVEGSHCFLDSRSHRLHAFNPKIKRLEPDVPTTWPLRDAFRSFVSSIDLSVGS